MVKAIRHARERIKERFGFEISNKIINSWTFKPIKRLTTTRSLCKVDNRDIFFIFNRKKKAIITFLTKEQSIIYFKEWRG